MRIAVFSDIHGNLSALQAVLSDIDRRGIPKMVNLGDTLSGPFNAVETADLLMDLDVPTVRGNHDRLLFDRPKDKMDRWESWVIKELSPKHIDWLKSFPLTLDVEGAFLCHATANQDDEDWLDFRGPAARLIARDLPGVEARVHGVTAPIILCGHTHTPRLVRLPSGQMIVNPGSVGCPAYLDSPPDPYFVHQTGAPDARYAIIERVNGVWRADLIAVPYDPTPMVELAKAKGAESWVKAITVGWIA